MKTTLLLLSLLGADKAPPKPAPSAEKPATYEVSRIRAYLYFHDKGEIDTRDMTTGNPALYNSSIGEGVAGGRPTDMLYVLVDLGGPSFVNVDGKLTIEAASNKKKLAAQAYDVGTYFNEKSSGISLPLLVPETPCSDVTLTATLEVKAGKGKTTVKSTKTAVVAYTCGE
jgi:hypothetical protein